MTIEDLCREHPLHSRALRGLWDDRFGGSTPGAHEKVGGTLFRAGEAPDDARHSESLGSLRPGSVIGEYELIRKLGQGGMGQVWEAHDTSFGRRVALKLLLPGRTDERALQFFAREARAGGRLNHPWIATVYTMGESDGMCFIAQELVDGSCTFADSLNHLRKQAALPPQYYLEVAQFFAKLAEALHVAHESGVVHRDVKPSNILVTENEEPKVTDFGLAKIEGEASLSRPGETGFTYAYMSPEQATLKQLRIDRRTDIFSLGTVLFEALTLQHPFVGDSPEQVLKKILWHDPGDPRRLRSKVPRDMAVICGKALEKDRERRYQTMAELAADLRRHLASEPILARAPGRVRRLQLWALRNPTKSVAGAVAAVSFIAISFLLAANLRANRQLLTTVTEKEAEIASVKRLSALQDYDDLVEDADESGRLWPPHPGNIDAYRDWLEDARRLLADLDLHRAKWEELSAMALPQSDEEREAERQSHPEFPRLEGLSAEIAARRAALLQRRDGIAVELPELAWERLPEDAAALNEIAFQLVDPERETYGREAEGLVLALHALELAEAAAEDGLVATVGDTLSWSLLALGRDDEALEASRAAAAVAPEAVRVKYEGFLSRVESQVEQARTVEGLRAAEEELAQLEAERGELEARLSERREWAFPDTKEGRDARWWQANLTQLIDALESLQDEETGLLSDAKLAVSAEHGWSVPRRLAFAERLRDGMVEGGDWAERWSECAAAVHGHAMYGDLELAPQDGLVPIGPDPESELLEFWHVATGEEPVRDADGKLVLTELTGLVLVLIPGGTFWMGSQRGDPAGHNFDPESRRDERPVHEVSLSPYFLSKYEMTQGQWSRFTGMNPSEGGPDREWLSMWLAGGRAPSLLHPVEQVSWTDCMRELSRMGLALPSEAQWENACRAGKETPWWSGARRESLRGVTNLGDAYAAGHGGSLFPGNESWLDDGATLHAPVGSYAANGFGLHDVIGNVWEWCLDGFDADFYGQSPMDDPVAPWRGANNRVFRGCSFTNRATLARSAFRNSNIPSSANGSFGVRPARAIEP